MYRYYPYYVASLFQCQIFVKDLQPIRQLTLCVKRKYIEIPLTFIKLRVMNYTPKYCSITTWSFFLTNGHNFNNSHAQKYSWFITDSNI